MIVRVKVGYGLDQSLRVRVCGFNPKLVAGCHLDQLAKIHHRGPMRDVTHDSEVMADKQICDIIGELKVSQ